MITVVLIGVLIVVIAALAGIYKFWLYSVRLYSTPASCKEIEEAFVLLKRVTRLGHLLRAQVESGTISAEQAEHFQLYMRAVESIRMQLFNGASANKRGQQGSFFVGDLHQLHFLMRRFDFLLKQNFTTHAVKTTAEPNNRHPPMFAEYLLYLLLPKKEREPLLGDLEEEYHDIYRRFGCQHARFWYCWQVGASLWPLVTRAVKKLIKWGVLGWVGDLLRRVIT
jgi:hypothetical protein